MSAFTTRFAPSPTGRLHRGHAFSALTAYTAARRAGGRFLLRIEDLDQGRCRPAFEAGILEDLAWLGVRWDGQPRRQSDHLDDYRTALERLIHAGVVYRCFKTRREVLDDIARAPHLAPDGPDGPAYVGAPLPDAEERARLAEGAPFAWRLSMRAALAAAPRTLTVTVDDTVRRADPAVFGDVILGRKDSGASYHLASVFDDARDGVTHVIRGDDLRAAADLHVLLQALLGLPHPEYRHHRLLLGPDGRRLAKRDASETLPALREAGETAEDLRRRLGFPALP